MVNEKAFDSLDHTFVISVLIKKLVLVTIFLVILKL